MQDPASTPAKVRYSVMYTSQTRRKKKTWQDGHLVYIPSKGKLVLKDDQDKTIAGHWIYREPRNGEELAFESHLVQIEGIEGEAMESTQFTPLELRTKPVENHLPHYFELENLLDKWKRGELVPEGQNKPPAPAPKPASTLSSVPETEPEPEHNDGDPLGRMIDWYDTGYRGAAVEQAYKGLASEPEPVEGIMHELDENSDRVISFSDHVVSPVADRRDCVSLLPPSTTVTVLEHRNGDSLFDLAETANNDNFIRSSPVSSPGPRAGDNTTADLLSSPDSPTASGSSQPLPSTQGDPPPQCPSLESLLAPPNRRAQGLYGLQRDSMSLREGDSLKTAAQVEGDDDCEAMYSKRAPRDVWMQKVPKDVPAQGRWTWEAYWLVDYTPLGVKPEPI